MDARKGPKWAKWRDRELYIERLIREGHVSLVPELRADNGLPKSNPRAVTVRVGLCTFSDTTQSFPTPKLVANVALAIQAGQSGAVFPIAPEIGDIYETPSGRRLKWNGNVWGEL